MSDAKLIKDYLKGDKNASNSIEKMIDLCLAEWRGKLGFHIDDIKSDVRYKLFNILIEGRFEQRSGLKFFIAQIANHTCIDYYRFNQKFTDSAIEDLDLPTKLFNPEQILEKKQLGRLIFRVLRLLPRECITLWRMHLNRDMSYSEIADNLGNGKSEENIKWRLWSCREKAKEIREMLLKKDKLS
ncbi:MAG: sigma-70 family RNA polymerase sigma factor [candidate division Zixibacteria bacterium]|nr:sigma-70 family RNA polymerase sigma factor [candidate division Zixibacteria bacterium]